MFAPKLQRIYFEEGNTGIEEILTIDLHIECGPIQGLSHDFPLTLTDIHMWYFINGSESTAIRSAIWVYVFSLM